MSSPHPQGPPLACVPTLPSRTPTHIFQSDDVGVLPVPQKNFNLFRGVSLALVNDLRKGVHVAVLEDQLQSPDLPQSPMLQGVESQRHTFHLTCRRAPCCRAWSLSRIPFTRPATEPHAAGRGVSAAHLSPDLPQSPMLQGVESQPHTFHLTCHRAPCCRAWSLSLHTFHPSTELPAPPLPDQRTRATSPATSTPAERPGLDEVTRLTLTAYSVLVALWTQRLHSEYEPTPIVSFTT